MSHRPELRLRHLCLLAVGSLAWAAAEPTEPLPSGLYRITTETGLPHLEENLRYAINRAERCLTQKDLPTIFPVLEHPALKSCHLGRGTTEGDILTYALKCESTQATTGEAVWQLGERQIAGTLNVKLGGKNMTFYQRVTGMLLGPCISPQLRPKAK